MKDIYVSLSGATAAWNNLSTIAQNVANASTQGYRETRVSFELAGPAGMGAQYAATGQTTFSEVDGALQQDNVETHVALRGNAFFALEDGTFTRDGAFQVDAEGRLTTRDGVAVLADGSPVELQAGESISIGQDGTLTGSKSGEIGKLDAIRLVGGSPLGGNRWTGTPEPVEEGIQFIQGSLEGSNVDTMRGMVEMMEASRFFEMQEKVMQASDDLRSRLNRIGGS